jgi:transposase-like protein
VAERTKGTKSRRRWTGAKEREAAVGAALAAGKGILKVARDFGTGNSVVQRIKAGRRGARLRASASVIGVASARSGRADFLLRGTGEGRQWFYVY